MKDQTGSRFFDVRQAKMRGRLENGELYFPGDWLLGKFDGLGDVQWLVNFEWDREAARADAARLTTNQERA